MPEDNDSRKPPKIPKLPMRRGDDEGPPEGPGFNWRSALLIFCAFSMVALFLIYRQGGTTSAQEIAYRPDFVTALKDGRVKSVQIVIDNGTGEQRLRGTMADAAGEQRTFWVPVNLDLTRDLEKTLADNGVENVRIEYSSNWVVSGLLSFLPVLIILLVLFLMFRQQIKMAGKGAFSFGKSKGRMITRDKNRVLFKDVAGVEEAKEEVQEIVEYLRDPKKFQKLGGRIPKGIMMVGPPGTGKTLLAKAIAGEADVPFFSISGSDFVEMFVGVGASRVRDMFEQGKRNAPCLIFIDEIDAVGRARGHGVGGGNDEREQTLNALLVEMDGFDTQEGVIIIAATNRKDVLDPALLRPGRFDREVIVNLPDVKGREEILKVHARKVKLGADVDLAVVARGTPGYSGADLANVINEAALIAARQGKKAIAQHDLEEARVKVRWGRERRSMAMSPEEKQITAYHEAGHALVNVLVPHTDPLHKVSIIPRGPALGVTMMLPNIERHTTSRKELLADLAVTMGGRVAEEVCLGDISSGASGDIRQATWFARKMVCEWGMSDSLGMIQYEEREDLVFLGRDIGRTRSHSEATQQQIDHEVRRIISEAYERAKGLITTHRDKLETIAKALLEYETLDATHIREIIDHGRILTPPATPKSKQDLDTEAEGEKPSPAAKGKSDDLDIPDGMEPAPIGA